MNPHKVLDAYLPTENLRLGVDYAPSQPKTIFKFVDDSGSFTKATERCIGLGACRKADNGAMCPSYMVTMEEEHSTRGRAHMLFEMLQGEIVADSWQNEEVKKSLDLCLACKACKSECPANVDIATYKAEFLHHYYEKKSRPLYAHAFGKIDQWAYLASFAPGLANFFSNAPGFNQLLRTALHLAPQRQMPRFASTSFQKWASKNKIPTCASTGTNATSSGPEVILWADTFNNYYHPQTSQRRARSPLPRRLLRQSSPGPPLLRPPSLRLRNARRSQAISASASCRPSVRRSTPEPPSSCSNPAAPPSSATNCKISSPTIPAPPGSPRQTFLLSEFLEQRVPGYQPPQLPRNVLLHGHCHHKSLMKMKDEESLLKKMGTTLQSLDAGCCGMAGPFGFEKDKYDVSLAVGERVLLPAVRKASAETLIVSDGFSCREQITQSGGRQAIHLAEALQLALHRPTSTQQK